MKLSRQIFPFNIQIYLVASEDQDIDDVEVPESELRAEVNNDTENTDPTSTPVTSTPAPKKRVSAQGEIVK